MSIAVAPPLNDEEFIVRLMRLNKGAGLDLAKTAFSKAFPQATPPGWSAVKREKSNMVYAPETVIEFYNMFPDFPKDPKTGLPPAYPVEANRHQKRVWIAKLAIKEARAREQGTDAEVAEPIETQG